VNNDNGLFIIFQALAGPAPDKVLGYQLFVQQVKNGFVLYDPGDIVQEFFGWADRALKEAVKHFCAVASAQQYFQLTCQFLRVFPGIYREFIDNRLIDGVEQAGVGVFAIVVAIAAAEQG
jgi:hypothetical protein